MANEVKLIACAFIPMLLVAELSCGAGATTLLAQHAPAEFSQLEISVVTAQPWSESAVEIPLLIHFHGAAKTTAQNFRRAGLAGALVTVNCKGLSSAYRKPFENDKLFPYLLEYVHQQLVADGKLGRNTEFSAIKLSCFSAGYGAVREILKSPQAIRQVTSVVAADSIYASIHVQDERRLVDEEQMEPFLKFAQRAVRGEKSFLISHSQLPVEPYASTVETADYLLKELGVVRVPIESVAQQAFSPIERAKLKRFAILSYPGSSGESHLDHLRNIAQLWKAAESED